MTEEDSSAVATGTKLRHDDKSLINQGARSSKVINSEAMISEVEVSCEHMIQILPEVTTKIDVEADPE